MARRQTSWLYYKHDRETEFELIETGTNSVSASDQSGTRTLDTGLRDQRSDHSAILPTSAPATSSTSTVAATSAQSVQNRTASTSTLAATTITVQEEHNRVRRIVVLHYPPQAVDEQLLTAREASNSLGHTLCLFGQCRGPTVSSLKREKNTPYAQRTLGERSLSLRKEIKPKSTRSSWMPSRP